MTTSRIAVVSGGLSQPSSTRPLADRLAAAERVLAGRSAVRPPDPYRDTTPFEDLLAGRLPG
ncbi:hypothetical protein [Nocardia sp. NPDC050793]|uniref:hypothetical protein n=1 Tax=Nocardia sp. NPDC050793 TaxID=3155159 RepID=UPI0033F1D4FF